MALCALQMAAMSGIFFATAVQIPATFASQFVMFLVMGIGLDGVFLMTVRPLLRVAEGLWVASPRMIVRLLGAQDTFDHAPNSLNLEDRIRCTPPTLSSDVMCWLCLAAEPRLILWPSVQTRSRTPVRRSSSPR